MQPNDAETPTADERADEVLAEALEAERQPRGGSGYPTALEIAASAGAALAVVTLGWASLANGATIPFLWGVDLGIHEFGHLVTFWAPWRVCAFAGSFFQVAVPLGFAAYFFFGRRSFGAAGILTAWAGCSARNVAVYIADAPYQRLPLWGGDGVLHDWAQLLAGRPMQYAGTIAWSVDAMGWLLVAFGLALALAPVVVRAGSAFADKTRAAAFEARRGTLPVREPRGPLG
jgi:hypothetical protein